MSFFLTSKFYFTTRSLFKTNRDRWFRFQRKQTKDAV